MPAQHTFTDITGELIVMEHLTQWAQCIVCGKDAAGAIDEVPVHMDCWNAAMEQLPTPVPDDHSQRTTDTNFDARPDLHLVTTGTAPAMPTTTPAALTTPPVPAPDVAAAVNADPSDADPDAEGDVDRALGAAVPDVDEESETKDNRDLPSFTASVAVLDVDGVHLPGQPVRPLEAKLTHLGEVADLAVSLNLGTIVRKAKNRSNKWTYRAVPGQLYITTEATLELLGLDELPRDRYQRAQMIKDHTTGHAVVAGALEAGWSMSKDGHHLEGTTRMWRTDDDRRAMITLIPMLSDDAYPVIADYTPKGKPTPAPAPTVATRFQKFADALQYPYTVSASSTGLDLLSETRRDREITLAVHMPVPPATIPGLVLDHNWSRTLTADEENHTWVHAYDRSASYLAAADTSYGVGDATHLTDNPTFDPKLPGYWKIQVPEAQEWLHPSIFNPAGRALEDTFWYTTETLAFAASELDHEVRPLEAYIWTNHTRLLSAWTKRVIQARTALDTPNPDDQAARDVLKNLYVRTFGMIGSHEHQAGRRGYAPERYDTLKGRAGANILRRILSIGQTTGRWPVAVFTDTLLYTSTEADPIAAWPGDPKHLSRSAGMYKPEGSAPLSEVRPHLTGKGFDLKAKILFEK